MTPFFPRSLKEKKLLDRTRKVFLTDFGVRHLSMIIRLSWNLVYREKANLHGKVVFALLRPTESKLRPVNTIKL